MPPRRKVTPKESRLEWAKIVLPSMVPLAIALLSMRQSGEAKDGNETTAMSVAAVVSDQSGYAVAIDSLRRELAVLKKNVARLEAGSVTVRPGRQSGISGGRVREPGIASESATLPQALASVVVEPARWIGNGLRRLFGG